MTTQSEYSLAYEQGQAARRNGKPRANHPYRYRRDADLLIERWTDGDGLSWLCRDCMRSAIHEHDAAIADRAMDVLEHGAAFYCECSEGAL